VLTDLPSPVANFAGFCCLFGFFVVQYAPRGFGEQFHHILLSIGTDLQLVIFDE